MYKYYNEVKKLMRAEQQNKKFSHARIDMHTGWEIDFVKFEHVLATDR